MAPVTKLKLAAIQMISTPNWQENLTTAGNLIAKAAALGAQVVVLPEFFIQVTSSDDSQRLAIAEELGAGIIQDHLAELARQNQVYLVAGTLLIKAVQQDTYYNTCIVYRPSGDRLCHYHKIHLFKFDDGVNRFDEGETFIAGISPAKFSAEGFEFGLSICYDLRFPELFRALGRLDAILLPSAFTYTTGLAHWELLCRARAVENQCYFVGVDQGGTHATGRRTYGHTLVSDPWGQVIASCTEGEHIVWCQIDKEVIRQVRSKLPALEHRRL